MFDKAPHEEWAVERRVLMQRARRQALREHLGRSHRCRRHKGGRTHSGYALDERQKYGGLADARAMQPDEMARRTRQGLARPRRSPTRSESSLPRRSRIARIGPANGVARNEVNR